MSAHEQLTTSNARFAKRYGRLPPTLFSSGSTTTSSGRSFARTSGAMALSVRPGVWPSAVTTAMRSVLPSAASAASAMSRITGSSSAFGPGQGTTFMSAPLPGASAFAITASLKPVVTSPVTGVPPVGITCILFALCASQAAVPPWRCPRSEERRRTYGDCLHGPPGAHAQPGHRALPSSCQWQPSLR